MMTEYKSKMNYWLALPISYPICLSVYGMIKGEWLGALAFVFLIGSILIVSYFTKYSVDGATLTVKTMAGNRKIDIRSIRKIEKTNSIVSTRALSLNRIWIHYNKYDEIVVSPKERQDFIDRLLAINPTIEIKV
ncbi:PH domain-containing protein [Flavobacterium humi]|uniref:Uncharacterized protein YyaB-like PH domain-containing protein n=1 Tax=Flavobacterium humi TaxID=2562683 RepID=A0A4Z0L636_9FLAO|nr:PH domain-containing protein [Flavobacterium humi]TGD57433.1 hypothetical protein E4635_12505 [Flavobacterium humi]